MKYNPSELLSIGEVSRRTGVAVSALRYYDDCGLISSHRTMGNHRLYPRHMIRRISLIQVAKRLGIPLQSVAEVLADLPHDKKASDKDWARIAERWRAELDARKQAIDQLQHELTGCIGCGCLSMSTCSLLNPNDSLGTDGPGPRRLHPTGPAIDE